MTMPVMEPDLDATVLRNWARGIDEGPFSSLCWGERIAFENPDSLTLLDECKHRRRHCGRIAFEGKDCIHLRPSSENRSRSGTVQRSRIEGLVALADQVEELPHGAGNVQVVIQRSEKGLDSRMRLGFRRRCGVARRLCEACKPFVDARKRSPRPGESSEIASRRLVLPAPFGPASTTGAPSVAISTLA